MARILDAFTIITLILILFCFKSTACQNAELTAIPVTVPVGGAITLICRYTGTQDETAVFWLNGSNSNPLTLTPASDVPECNVFSVVSTTYDLSRIRYTCDSEMNIYTLTLDFVQSVDDNVKWSCTFSDPVPDSNLAEYVIHLGDNNTGQIALPLAVGAGVGVGVFAFVAVLIYIKYFRKKNHGRCLSNRKRARLRQKPVGRHVIEEIGLKAVVFNVSEEQSEVKMLMTEWDKTEGENKPQVVQEMRPAVSMVTEGQNEARKLMRGCDKISSESFHIASPGNVPKDA